MSKYGEQIASIAERVKDLPEMKQDIKDIKERQNNHETRVRLIEQEHKKPFHNGTMGFFLKLFFGK